MSAFCLLALAAAAASFSSVPITRHPAVEIQRRRPWPTAVKHGGTTLPRPALAAAKHGGATLASRNPSEWEPARAAIERLVRVESMRLRELCEVAGKPAHVLQRLNNAVRQRTPIVHWASEQWLTSLTGRDAYGAWNPTLRKCGLLPWQLRSTLGVTVGSRAPPLLTSLATLRHEMIAQMRISLMLHPWRAGATILQALFVSALAVAMEWPGCGKLRHYLPRSWPRLLARVAETLERNYLADHASVLAAFDPASHWLSEKRRRGRKAHVGRKVPVKRVSVTNLPASARRPAAFAPWRVGLAR